MRAATVSRAGESASKGGTSRAGRWWTRRPSGPAPGGSPRKKRRSAANASASPALAHVTTTGPARRSSTRARHSAGALPRSPPTRTHLAGCWSSTAVSRVMRSVSDVCMAPAPARSALRSSAGVLGRCTRWYTGVGGGAARATSAGPRAPAALRGDAAADGRARGRGRGSARGTPAAAARALRPRRFRLQRRRHVFARLPAEQRREVRLLLLARRGLGAAHRALALEDRALVHDQARGRDVAGDLGRGVQLEQRARRDVARHLPVHDHRGAVDLRLQHGALTDGERVLGRDLALHLALDAHRALEGELAVHPAALAEERARPRRLLRLGLFPLEHLHLPGRRVGRRRGLGALAPLLVLAIPPEERHGCCRCIGVTPRLLEPPLQAPRTAGITSSANAWISSSKKGTKSMKMKCVTPARA